MAGLFVNVIKQRQERLHVSKIRLTYVVEKTSLHTCPYCTPAANPNPHFSLRLDRLHELLGFNFFELQLRRKPLRVVLVLEVVHALRADRIAPLGRCSQVVLQAERTEQLLEARDVGVAASCWLGRGGKFYRSPC